VRSQVEVDRGTYQLIAFNIITGLLLYCLACCILTRPGTIPDFQGWELTSDPSQLTRDGSSIMHSLQEKKMSGELRHCKWCLKYKPDRCHHCRICNVCVLRMDHHCPWVYNCIGFRNHKYFMLLLIYTVCDLFLISITMFDSVWWSTRIDVSIATMLMLTFGETFAAFLTVLTTAFLAFHIWLMFKAMTTVEFCEKSLKNDSYDSSTWSLGTYNNMCAVLGPNPLLWFVPLAFPQGDGLTWKSPSWM